MDTEHIKELTELFEEKGLSKMEICEGDTKILFEKELAGPAGASPLFSTTIPAGGSPLPSTSVSPLLHTAEDVDFNNLTEVKSPMVGVFYAAASPDSEPFVDIGTKVKKGDVLCIVEAMKLMNEIVAEVDGEIADICADSGQVVEFSQTLFKIF